MADPTAIATSFLGAYSGMAAAGNAAGLNGLYGPDSFASYDGTPKRGQAEIAAAFVVPRMPLQVKYSTVLVQPTPVNTLLVVTNGESDKPAGRFTQVFILAPTAAGGFYIKADVCRCVPRCSLDPPPHTHPQLAPARPSPPLTSLPSTPPHPLPPSPQLRAGRRRAANGL